MPLSIESSGCLYTFAAGTWSAPHDAVSFGCADQARRFLQALARDWQAGLHLEQLYDRQAGGPVVGKSRPDKLDELSRMLADGRLTVVQRALSADEARPVSASDAGPPRPAEPYDRWSDGGRPLDPDVPAKELRDEELRRVARELRDAP